MELKAVKRTATDGLDWWVVYDESINDYTKNPYLFGRFKKKSDCTFKINYYINNLKN